MPDDETSRLHRVLACRSHFGHKGAAVSREEKAQEGSPGFRRAQPLGSLSSPHPQSR